MAGLLVWTWSECQEAVVQASLLALPLLSETELHPHMEVGACIVVSEVLSLRAGFTRK